MSGGKSDYVSSPSRSDHPQPPNPFPQGSWGIPVKHLEWEGPQSGQGQGPAGVGGFLLCPYLSPPLAPHPHLFPRWRRKIFYFLLFITSDLGPLFFLPINLSDQRERQTDAPRGWLDKDFYFLLHKNMKKNKKK